MSADTVALEVVAEDGSRVLKSDPVPAESVSDYDLLTLGRIAEEKLGARSILNMFVHMESEPCTELSGEGSYGVVLKVCSLIRRSTGECDGCVALKVANQESVDIEKDAWKAIAKVEAAEPFVPKFYAHVTHLGLGAIVMEQIEPLRRGIATLAQYVELASSTELAANLPPIVLQVLWTVAALQAKIPGFRHNDLKVDNVMLTPNRVGREITLSVRGSGVVWGVPNTSPIAKIIDYGLAWAPRRAIPNKFVIEAPRRHEHESPGELEESGILPVPSAMYDVHSFLASLVSYLDYRVQREIESRSSSFEDLDRIQKTREAVRAFQRRVLGPLAEPRYTVPEWGRLNLEGQQAETRMLRNDLILPPVDALARKPDPLFDDLRSQSAVGGHGAAMFQF
jgi:hypothetical protein